VANQQNIIKVPPLGDLGGFILGNPTKHNQSPPWGIEGALNIFQIIPSFFSHPKKSSYLYMTSRIFLSFFGQKINKIIKVLYKVCKGFGFPFF